ncbi:MAG: maltose/maltodextrin ABC transporter substrate-binding protein MalE [Verrucomicrobia bacterium]|nr:maltose/maltodextrin ABC transporter substrate-binding protein MalE [Verrucomicrobiota bacterium]
MKTLLLSCLFCFATLTAHAWVDGELLIWMDADRAGAIQPAIDKFQKDFGIHVRVETPEKITDNFPLAAQCGKGPDIVIWAHDKVGEWASSGLIAPVEVSSEYQDRFFAKAWDAVRYDKQLWGYPLCFEVVGLIYNRKLVAGDPPSQLSDLVAFNERFKKEHPDYTSILWDYNSPYYSWGILASGGAYIFAQTPDGYDLKNVGVASPGAVDALNEMIKLIHAGVLPKMASSNSGTAKQLMAQGKLAMMISGPWDWPDLMKSGIDFGVAPIPGTNGQPGKAFVGVSVAYINHSSPNRDLAKELLENYLITDETLAAANRVKPIGIPALKSLYDQMSVNNDLLRDMKVCADKGEVMPNIPQMGRFWSSMSSALQIATLGQATAQNALAEAKANMLK